MEVVGQCFIKLGEKAIDTYLQEFLSICFYLLFPVNLENKKNVAEAFAFITLPTAC